MAMCHFWNKKGDKLTKMQKQTQMLNPYSEGLKKQNEPMRDRAKTLAVAKSTASKVDDYWILSLVKKQKQQQNKNTLHNI